MQQHLEWLDGNRQRVAVIMAPLLLILIAAVYFLVYATGGIKFVYSHSMYIPILLSGFVFGIKGGVTFGMVAGVALGPFMPINVATGERQETINWLYRTGFFTLIGFLAGAASDGVRAYLGHLKWLARHDATTGLPNRSALIDTLTAMGRETRGNDPHALAIIVISNSMELRSAFGFEVIEAVIGQLAERIREQGVADSVYHIDSTQLAVVMTAPGATTEAQVKWLSEVCRDPVSYHDIPIHVDVKIGHAAIAGVDQSPQRCLQHAEAALTVAQKNGQESVAYHPELTRVTENNMAILGGLKDAIRQGQLSLHYQPKVAIATGEVHGVEALVRWNHPERGDIPPAVFVPRAEQSTLIHVLTDFVLNEAMAQMARWRQADIDIPVAVNISPQSLLQSGFTEHILGLLQQHQLSGESLELEITEGALMQDIDGSIEKLVSLSDARMIISIDDFGTGYSSLQYLHRLPTSLIKIDQSFVRGLPADKGSAYIVDAAVMLAHRMDMKVLAEGVEHAAAHAYLDYIGCDLAQGYLVSRALPADEFAQWYRQRQQQINA